MGEAEGDALIDGIVCPIDRQPLEQRDETLTCAHRHSFPCPDGIPVLVDLELAPTQHDYWAHREDIERVRAEPAPAVAGDEVDPYVAHLMVGTHGNLYRALDRVPRYPVPPFPRTGDGERLPDVGCNWGRWALSAARAGFDATGVDPSFEAIVPAVRIARQLGVDAGYAVADARRLPFADASFDLLSPRARAVVRASETLRRVGTVVPLLGLVADSLWVEARKAA